MVNMQKLKFNTIKKETVPTTISYPPNIIPDNKKSQYNDYDYDGINIPLPLLFVLLFGILLMLFGLTIMLIPYWR